MLINVTLANTSNNNPDEIERKSFTLKDFFLETVEFFSLNNLLIKIGAVSFLLCLSSS